MRFPLFRTLPVLLVAGAVAAGCADAPTMAVSPPASAGATAPQLTASGTPLSATVSCPGGRDYYTNRVDCTATATGGSGTGYSFSWNGSANEYYDQGGTSKALVLCQTYSTSGYYSSGSLTAYGTVTDSNGASVYFSTSRSC